MPRVKQSVSDRIVSDVLGLPLGEATLLIGFLQAALKARVLQPVARKERVPTISDTTRLAPQPQVPRTTTERSTMPAESVRRPRVRRIPPSTAGVPVGDPGPVEEVGDDARED